MSIASGQNGCTQPRSGSVAPDRITGTRSSGSGALGPTNTFNQSGWQSWSSTQYDNQHRTSSSRVDFLIPSLGTGTVGTSYGYDALERQNRVKLPGGTITKG